MQARHPRIMRVASIAMILCLMSCHSNAAYRTVPVTGILTCQGKPLAGVQVMFSPRAENGREARSAGRSGMARTDENGRFTLSTYGLNDGAVVGKHTVSILILDDARAPVSDAAKKNAAPCLNTTVEVEVTPGMGEVALNLGQ